MRILVASPGHLPTAPMGRYCAETLRQLGHEILVADSGSLTLAEKLLLRPVAKLRGRHRIEKTRLNQRLLKAAVAFHPDLLLAIFGFDIFPETIATLRKAGVRTACWWLNDPFQFERGLSIAGAYDYFFTNCAISARRYREAGLANVHPLAHAAFPAAHHPVELRETERKKWASEACFVGDWGPVRQGILSMLSQRIDLRIWGPWRKHLTPKDRLWNRVVDGHFTTEDMARAFSCAKAAINLHAWFGYYNHGLNPRTFEAPACGALQVCDWKEELEHHFRANEEVVTYHTGAELESRLRDLLANASTRHKIAAAGLRRVQKEHTYEHRMRELLCTLGF